MAKLKNGHLDGFSGKLGKTVGYEWKGRKCMRAWVKPKDPKTSAQLDCRNIFGKASSLGSDLMQVIKIGFRDLAAKQSNTEKNMFVKLNRQHISIVNNELVVDYAHLQVADGPLETVDFGEPEVTGEGKIRVTFSNSARANRLNYVMLVAYLPEQRNCMLSEPVFRSTRVAEIILPESWVGHEAHIYGFCWDGQDEVSPSSYIGIVNRNNP